jgi:hypothetical protein
MSERTFASKCCRSRASEMEDLRRRSSWRCSVRTSRWRERLFCLREEVLRADSESRSRESWDISPSRCVVRTSAHFHQASWVSAPSLTVLGFLLHSFVPRRMVSVGGWRSRRIANKYGRGIPSSKSVSSQIVRREVPGKVTWLSSVLSCWRSCAHPPAAIVAFFLTGAIKPVLHGIGITIVPKREIKSHVVQ